jgi:uncharacterized membrane protein YeaQ/YmgE (transglycosylase-associated protein family)
MWQTIVLGLLAGIFAGNGVPHFVRGITKQTYPMVFGNGPVPNLIAGWTGLVVAAYLAHLSRTYQHPHVALAAIAIGVLIIGLFHAGPGAFGKKK